ncbi:Ig domain-containing protein [Listeria monocytogenes]|nr:Ig domain-containing protein [Listeria monocytogenes]
MLRSSQRSLAVSLMTKHQKLQNPETSPSSVTVDHDTIAVKVGETSTITASVLPVGASQEVTFTSSNPPKAKVNASGVVEGVAEGTANITVASKESPSINKVVQVTVEAAD